MFYINDCARADISILTSAGRWSIFESLYPEIDDTDLHEIRLSADFEARKLWTFRQGTDCMMTRLSNETDRTC